MLSISDCEGRNNVGKEESSRSFSHGTVEKGNPRNRYNPNHLYDERARPLLGKKKPHEVE